MKDLIETIIEEMLNQGITGLDMADMIGISGTAFNTKRAGRSDFTASEIEKMCMILGLEIIVQPATERIVHPEKWFRPYKGRQTYSLTEHRRKADGQSEAASGDL